MKNATCLSVAALVLLTPLAALGDDIKTIPASMCRPNDDWFARGGFLSPAVGAPLASPPRYGVGHGELYIDPTVPASSANQVNCSLPRDFTTNLTGLSDIKIYVFDSSATTSISCVAFSSSADAVQSFTSQTLMTGTTYVSPHASSTLLEFTASMVNQSWVRGYWTVSCTLNAGDTLFTLFYSEPGAGDGK